MGRLNRTALIFLFILFGCADGLKLTTIAALEEGPIKQEIIINKGIPFKYAIYKNPVRKVGASDQDINSLVYVLLNSQQKKKLPKDYMLDINKDGHRFIKKYCPGYVNSDFIETNIKVDSQHIIAMGTACHLE